MKPLLIRLAKALFKLALDEGLRRALPLVYKRLDAELPVLLSHNVPAPQVKGAIASAIADAVGHRATPAQVEAVIGLYDPVKAALRRL